MDVPDDQPVIPNIHLPQTVAFAANAAHLVYEQELKPIDAFMLKQGFMLQSWDPDQYGRGLRARMYVREKVSALDVVFVYRGIVLRERGNLETLLAQILRAATHGTGGGGAGGSGGMVNPPALVQQAVDWTEERVYATCRNLYTAQQQQQQAESCEDSSSGDDGRRLDSKRVHVLLTGHSLGGLIAKLALIRLVGLNSGIRPAGDAVANRLGAVGCIAFDAPGLLEHELASAQRLCLRAADWEAVLSEYLFYPNPVNMYGTHSLGALTFLEHDLEATPEWIKLCQAVKIAAANPLATLAPRLAPKWISVASIAASVLSNNNLILCPDHAKAHAKFACELEAIGLHYIKGRLPWLTDTTVLRRVSRRMTGWPSIGTGEEGVKTALDKIFSAGYHGVGLAEFEPTPQGRKHVAMAPLRWSGVCSSVFYDR